MAREKPLPDVLPAHPRILFVGINPSLRSGALGHHYAGKNNPFWRLLFAAKLIPEPIGFCDDARMSEWGFGLTNLCDRPTRAASELTREELVLGRAALRRQVARLRPEVLACVGLTVYARVFDRPTGGGAGEKPERLSGARVFALPNPSGLNASYPSFADKLYWFERLRAFARLPPPDPTEGPGAAV